MILTLRPLGRGRYAAALTDGRILVECKTPIFSAARQLIREGVSEREPLIVHHVGSSTISTTTTVGTAARLTAEETDARGPRLRKYRPLPSEMPQEVGRVTPRTAIMRRDDAQQPTQTEDAFSDDYCASEVVRIRSILKPM